MEITLTLLIYLFTFIFPINGLVLLGIINERKKNRKILMAIWKMGNRK